MLQLCGCLILAWPRLGRFWWRPWEWWRNWSFRLRGRLRNKKAQG